MSTFYYSSQCRGLLLLISLFLLMSAWKFSHDLLIMISSFYALRTCPSSTLQKSYCCNLEYVLAALQLILTSKYAKQQHFKHYLDQLTNFDRYYLPWKKIANSLRVWKRMTNTRRSWQSYKWYKPCYNFMHILDAKTTYITINDGTCITRNLKHPKWGANYEF